jgi:Peptidase family M28
MKCTVPVVVLALAGCARAGTSIDITRDDLTYRVGVLADDSMLGRDAGQVGNVRATDYIARELERLGLEAAGVDGWFQAIPLVTRTPVDGHLAVEGGDTFDASRILSLRPVGLAPFGGLLDAREVETVWGGRLGERSVYPEAAEGKVIVFGATGENSALTVGLLTAASALATYANAAGILIAGLDRTPAPFIANMRSTRIVLSDPSNAVQTIPAALASDAIVAAIFGTASPTSGKAGRRVDVRIGLEEGATPEPARNVIAIVRGKDATLRNEFVAIGAHSDHVGTGTPVDHDSVRAANAVVRPLGANGPARAPDAAEADRIRAIRDSVRTLHPPRMDSIFNGADDDASGSAVVLELAEYFSRNPTRRSLLLVFHTAEEKGLFGAAYFTDHPTVARDSIVAQINMDQVSRGGPEDVAGSQPNTVYLLGSRRLSTQLGDLVESINERTEHRLRLDYTLDADGHPANGYCRSDHYMYARYGIPIVFLSAGWHRDYHMVSDEVEYTNPETMYAIGTFARDIAASVANADERPVVDHPKPDPRAPCRQ